MTPPHSHTKNISFVMVYVVHNNIIDWKKLPFYNNLLTLYSHTWANLSCAIYLPYSPEAFHDSLYVRVWRWIRGPAFPPEKTESGIGGDAIPRCLEGLTCTLQSLLSRYSIAFSIHSHPPFTLTYFYANFDKLRDPHFFPEGRGDLYGTPRLPVAPPVGDLLI